MVDKTYAMGDRIKLVGSNCGTRRGAEGIVIYARPDAPKGETKYLVHWYMSENGYRRTEPEIGRYKSDWLTSNTLIIGEPEPASEQGRGRFMCLVEGGTTPPRLIHTTEESARREAERLSRVHGVTARVLRVVGSVNMKRIVQYEPEWANE